MPRWTESAKQEQAQKIQQWQPWLKSTGPRSEQGKAIASRNRCPSDFFDFHGIEIRADTQKGRKLLTQLIGTLVHHRLGIISADECEQQLLDLLCKFGYLESEKCVEHVDN
ncbi:MAG: hypothetical protein M3O33_23805 [Cyanobacteriota bacterium]|nr:hypothetical protein [Cyanobacteriota bacterium]